MNLLEHCRENLKQHDEQIYKSQEIAVKSLIEELEKQILIATKNGRCSYNMTLTQTETHLANQLKKSYIYTNINFKIISETILSTQHIYNKLVEYFDKSAFDVNCFESASTLFLTIAIKEDSK